MDKKCFQDKIKSMEQDTINFIRKESDRLFDCGAIDTESYEDNFILPKIVLTVALENLTKQIALPDNKEYKKEIKNLRYF